MRRCRSSFRLTVFIGQLRISVPFPVQVIPRCMPWATLQTTWPLRTTATWAPTSCFLDLRAVESEDLGAFFLILGIHIGSMYGIFTYYTWLIFYGRCRPYIDPYWSYALVLLKKKKINFDKDQWESERVHMNQSIVTSKLNTYLKTFYYIKHLQMIQPETNQWNNDPSESLSIALQILQFLQQLWLHKCISLHRCLTFLRHDSLSYHQSKGIQRYGHRSIYRHNSR